MFLFKFKFFITNWLAKLLTTSRSKLHFQTQKSWRHLFDVLCEKQRVTDSITKPLINIGYNVFDLYHIMIIIVSEQLSQSLRLRSFYTADNKGALLPRVLCSHTLSLLILRKINIKFSF